LVKTPDKEFAKGRDLFDYGKVWTEQLGQKKSSISNSTQMKLKD